MPRIYISHRPEDSSRNEVTIIRERLIAEFGEENILQSTGSNMEVTTNLQRLVQSCDVLLVVIGRYWVNMVDEQGNYLLEDPYDPIHVEIDAGLKTTMVVAVLVVDGVPIPAKNQLPEVLQPVLKKVILEAPDHNQLEDILDELIPLWEAIPTGKMADEHGIDEGTLAQQYSNVSNVVRQPSAYEQRRTQERVQQVISDNPPYRPPAQRRSRHGSPDTNENQSQSFAEKYARRIAVMLILGFISFIFNSLDDNDTRRTVTDPVILTLEDRIKSTVQAEREEALQQTPIPNAYSTDEPRETIQADRENSNSSDSGLRIRSVNFRANGSQSYLSKISFSSLFEYDYPVTDMEFHPFDHTLLTYETAQTDNKIWSLPVDTNKDAKPFDDSAYDYSRIAFEDLVKRPIKEELDTEGKEAFTRQTGQAVIFSAIDNDNSQIVVVSGGGTLYILESTSLNLLSAHKLEIFNLSGLDRKKIVYDTHDNLLMIADDNQLSIWNIGRNVVRAGRVNLEANDIEQIVLHRNGEYLAVRNHSRVITYDILRDYRENVTEVVGEPKPLTDIKFNSIYEYEHGVAQIGFHSSEDVLFIHHPQNEDNALWYISMNSKIEAQPSSYYSESQNAFDQKIQQPISQKLSQMKIDELELKIGSDIKFSVTDWEDRRAIIISEDNVIYLLDTSNLTILSDYRLDGYIDNDSVLTEMVAYDLKHNRLMILVDGLQLMVWDMNDSINYLGEVTLESIPINQIVLPRSGEYLATRSDENVIIYRVLRLR